MFGAEQTARAGQAMLSGEGLGAAARTRGQKRCAGSNIGNGNS